MEIDFAKNIIFFILFLNGRFTLCDFFNLQI